MLLRIKELREFLGLTQAQLAINAGVDRTSLVKWEGGKNVPNANDYEKLVQFFTSHGVVIDIYGNISEMLLVHATRAKEELFQAKKAIQALQQSVADTEGILDVLISSGELAQASSVDQKKDIDIYDAARSQELSFSGSSEHLRPGASQRKKKDKSGSKDS